MVLIFYAFDLLYLTRMIRVIRLITTARVWAPTSLLFSTFFKFFGIEDCFYILFSLNLQYFLSSRTVISEKIGRLL